MQKCIPTKGSGTHEANRVPGTGVTSRSSPWSEQASGAHDVVVRLAVGLGVGGALAEHGGDVLETAYCMPPQVPRNGIPRSRTTVSARSTAASSAYGAPGTSQTPS